MSTSTRFDTGAIKARCDLPTVAAYWLTLVTRQQDHYKALCPFHPDKDTPSLALYHDHYHCFGCAAHGDVIALVMVMENLDFIKAIEWLIARYDGLDAVEVIAEAEIVRPTTPVPYDMLRYWQSLMTAEVRAWYNARGLNDETIARYMLGWDGNNYVTPAWEGKPGESDVFGVAFRKSDGTKPKYFGLRGRNYPILFNRWILEGAIVGYVFIGQYDVMLAVQDGLAAVTSTGGQLTWLPEWNQYFAHLDRVYVVPDVGEYAAGFGIASQIGTHAKVGRYPEIDGVTDYTDYRGRGSYADFHKTVIQPLGRKLDVVAHWESR